MTRRKTQNSNLFAIDFDAIENVLQDANAPLISAAEDLLDRGSLIQEIVDTSDAENLKEIVAQIRDQGKQLSKARLSDGRPFTDASSVVKNWFGKTEDRLKALDRRLSGILASYVSRVAAEAEEVRRRNDERERAAAALQPSNDVPQDVQIGSSLSGESIVTVNTPEVAVPVEQEVELEIEPEVPDVKLECYGRTIRQILERGGRRGGSFLTRRRQRGLEQKGRAHWVPRRRAVPFSLSSCCERPHLEITRKR